MTDLPVPLGPLVGSQPINVADAVERLARLQAVDAWIGDVKLSLREWLMVEAVKVRESSGAPANWNVKPFGRALVTDPEACPRVVDPDAFGAWLKARPPLGSMVGSVLRVEVTDHANAWGACDALRAALTAGEGEYAVKAAAELLGSLRPFVAAIIGEGALEEAVTDGHAAIVGADGQWGMVELDSETGELGDAVPGVIVTRANETLTVTIDKAAKARLSAELARILAPTPVLVEPEAGE